MAVREMLIFLNEGYEWIVDIDLEKFFDNVPQDKLMSLVHSVINDGDTESLIRKYLKAGVMVQRRYEKTDRGTPQGGNLSTLLSNIMLNELDKELEKRGLRYVRYADDCVIAVRSETSAKRVMYSITDWIQRKLGLKVNAEKTRITRPGRLKYLGFGFYKDSKAKKRQWGLQKLGIGKDLARQTSYMGDHYQWVVTKTCVVRAISKEKLSQAGLVSCYDYYLGRHTLKVC